jgi:hypothetical protein
MFDETALMMATDAEKAQALLAAGAPVNARNRNGDTALWFALFRGERDRALLLIAAGADVDARAPLLVAAHFGDAEVVRALLRAGADVHVRDLNGNTPLHWAAKNLRRGVVEAVLTAYPDVNAQANDGRTALMLAAQEGYTENVRALLAAGADSNIRDAAGQSPLEWAQARNNAELVALLQSRGAVSPAQTAPLAELKRGAREGGLSVSTTDLATDGRFAKIRGLVRNGYAEPVEGIRYEVILLSSDRGRVYDTLRHETDVTIAPGDDAPLKIDAESMYFGGGGSVIIRALPKKVGGRELLPPPGWPEE